MGHVTKLVPIRLGEPKEGQQHHNSAVDLPSNQLTTYQRNLHITNTTCRATRYGWTDSKKDISLHIFKFKLKLKSKAKDDIIAMPIVDSMLTQEY